MEERCIVVAMIHLVTAISMVAMVECAFSSDVPSIVTNSIQDICSQENNDEDLRRNEDLVNKMFGKLKSLLSGSIEIPRFQENIGTSGLLCTSETSVGLQVRDITSNICYQQPFLNRERVNVLFQASMTFKEPVIFNTFIDETKKSFETFCDATSKTGSVQYTFPTESYVSLILSVNVRPQVQTEFLKSECSVFIHEIKVDSVTIPDVKEIDNTVSGIGNRLWNSMKGKDFTTMVTIGIMEALVGKLQPNSNVMQGNDNWVCLDGFDKFRESMKKKVYAQGYWAYKKQNYSPFISLFQKGIEKAITNFKSETVKSDDPYTVTMSDVSGKFESFNVVLHSPLTFLQLRQMFGVDEDYYLTFFCQDSLIELSNPGKSGAGLYVSRDAKFIAKTLKSSEVTTLEHLLQPFLKHMGKNPSTLLTKFFGLYTYVPASFLKQLLRRNLNMVVMNNIMPSDLEIISQKYDLKGSRHNREASEDERKKINTSPTYKDNDFLVHHSQGIYLKAKDYDRLVNAITSDSKILNKLNIVDYSLLLGIVYEGRVLKKEERERATGEVTSIPCESKDDVKTTSGGNNQPNSIPALTVHGERVMLHLGIIDMLQEYVFKKKVETVVKNAVGEEDFSVVDSNTYSTRFINFMQNKVFKKMLPCVQSKTLGDFLKEKPNPSKTLGDLFKENPNPSKTLGDLFKETPNPSKKLGDFLKEENNSR